MFAAEYALTEHGIAAAQMKCTEIDSGVGCISAVLQTQTFYYVYLSNDLSNDFL